MVRYISIISVFLLIMACGKQSSDNSQTSSSPRQEVEESASAGGIMYKSHLLPLNSLLAGSPTGVLEWMISSTQMRISLTMTNTPEDLEHFQAVHSGRKCPTNSADTNADGVIDAVELQKVSGKMLFPLDSDIYSLNSGDFVSSRSNEYGNYVYWSEVENEQFRSISTNSTPDKLVVVVYGIQQQYSLPPTVSALNGSTHRYIPISCGVISEVALENLY